MKGYLFFVVAIVIGYILWSRAAPAKSSASQRKEGFQDTMAEAAASATAAPAIPLVSPRQQTLQTGKVQDFAPPSSELLAPPPGQIASVNPLPAEDPAMKKASAGRIQSVSESMAGFFEREAPGLKDLGDPSIQLPLNTAKADRARLKDELDVLKRNPGLESSLTEEDLNGIEANLGYLQRKWRMSVNSGAVSPMPPAGPAEGFAGGRSTGWRSWFQTLLSQPQEEGFASGTQTYMAGNSSNTSNMMPPGQGITMKDLQDITLAIDVEIARLEESGTNDLNVKARIDNFRRVKNTFTGLISAIESGERDLSSVNLTKGQVATYLKAIENPNTPVTDLIKDSGLNSLLTSLFPYYGVGDISGAKISQQLLDTYASNFLGNLSWDVNLKYKGEAEKQIAKNYADAMMSGKFMAESELEAAKVKAQQPGPIDETTKNAYRGMFQSIISDLTGGRGITADVGVSGPGGKSSTDEADADGGGGPEKPFNWKTRVTHICGQISKRGMNPDDFGCLKNESAEKYQGFSWRGHAKMVCNRLGTVYDPGVPELCGCPPPTWPGWRS
jgi:hypothetical protein